MLTLRNLLIGLILVGLVANVFIAWINEGSIEYGITTDGNFSDVQERLNNTIESQRTVAQDIKDFGDKIDEGTIIGIGGGVLSGASALVGVFKMPFTSILTFNEILKDAALLIGVPIYLYFIFWTLVLVVVILIVVNAVSKYKYT